MPRQFCRGMTRFHFILRITALLTVLLTPFKTWAADENQKIEQLIAKVEALDAKFIRNGSEYDPKTAGKFLRGKWDHNKSTIKTAGDFITQAGSVSSTSGKAYMIRFKDGTERKCGDYLTEELAKLNSKEK